MRSDRKVYCKSCYREVWVSYEYNRCPFCEVPLDLNNEVFSYVIKRYSPFSFRYEYTLDGQQRYIFASSTDELKEKVLERGFPWDDERIPNEKKFSTRKRYNFDKMETNSKRSTVKTIICPYCEKEVGEDDSRCPYCMAKLKSNTHSREHHYDKYYEPDINYEEIWQMDEFNDKIFINKER